jgi:hypothetical protein|tara:strand:+ start:313 stop:540 length:228 start_codon:yes stop_codon:yes gene_type:complete
MTNNRNYEIVYSDFKLLNGLNYRDLDKIVLTKNDVQKINQTEYSDYDETDFYILLGLQIEDLIDDLKFTTTITYK